VDHFERNGLVKEISSILLDSLSQEVSMFSNWTIVSTYDLELAWVLVVALKVQQEGSSAFRVAVASVISDSDLVSKFRTAIINGFFYPLDVFVVVHFFSEALHPVSIHALNFEASRKRKVTCNNIRGKTDRDS